MSQFVIEPSFWNLFPQAEIGIVVVRGVENGEGVSDVTRAEIADLLAAANDDARSHLTAPTVAENRVVAVWREAFTRFKTKKGARSSIEALLKRVDKGNPVGTINPLVDLYNSLSLRYALPFGGEDLKTFVGDLRLTVTSGGDPFMALGDAEPDSTLPGEVCYLDDAGAVCRCWNWRDGQRTMLTESTTDAFLIIESCDPARSADVEQALEALATQTVRYLGGVVTARQVLSIDVPSVELS